MEHKIDRILSTLSNGGDRVHAPIDLESLCGNFRVLEIQDRHMVPEAATEPIVGGFRVYLQNNFSDAQGTSSRRRFTLAHEFCHTLFYDCTAGVPARIKDAPHGENIEALCHRGAGLLLVPTSFLRQELELLGGAVSAEDVPGLAEKFEVSIEVILHRLQEVIGPPVDSAVILVGSLGQDTRPHVLGWYSGPWLLSYFAAPKYGLPLESWLKGTSADEHDLRGGFKREIPGGMLVGGEPVPLTRGRFLFDVTMGTADAEAHASEKS